MGERAQKEAWVTLATNDAYALGCLVVGNSLRRVQTTRQLAVMVTDGVSASMRMQLQSVFDSMVDVSVLDSEDARNLSLLGRPDLNVTYTKIHCWELTQYEKGVFLDADTLVVQNCDELFDREELSAAPDAGWPDCFNSGVFVFKPSIETYHRLVNFALTTGSFDGGDQGLLNSFFNTWPTQDIAKHLPFIYNVVSQAFYSYLPAFTQFRDKIKIVHFIGPIKPWHHPYNTATKTVTVFPESGHSYEFLQIWWDLFMELVQPRLDPTLTPFIRFEYILPSSQPVTSLSSPHGMEDSHQESLQPASYQVLYPYVPPALDQEFYTPPQGQPSPHHDVPSTPPPSPVCQQEETCLPFPVEETAPHNQEGGSHDRSPEVPQVVDMPIVSRIFHPYETHYAEEPLLLINPDSPPSSIYESSQFEQIVTVEAEKIHQEEQSGDDVIVVVDDSKDDSQGAAEDEIRLVNDGDETSVINKSDAGEENRSDHDKSKENQSVKSNQMKENGPVKGLVGELAQIKLDGGGESADYMVLDDRERRLAWERGHADYLGMDSFENIMKKLDEKMAPTPGAKEVPRKSEGTVASQSEASLTKPAEKKSEQGRTRTDKVSPRQRSMSLDSCMAVGAPNRGKSTRSTALKRRSELVDDKSQLSSAAGGVHKDKPIKSMPASQEKAIYGRQREDGRYKERNETSQDSMQREGGRYKERNETSQDSMQRKGVETSLDSMQRKGVETSLDGSQKEDDLNKEKNATSLDSSQREGIETSLDSSQREGIETSLDSSQREDDRNKTRKEIKKERIQMSMESSQREDDPKKERIETSLDSSQKEGIETSLDSMQRKDGLSTERKEIKKERNETSLDSSQREDVRKKERNETSVDSSQREDGLNKERKEKKKEIKETSLHATMTGSAVGDGKPPMEGSVDEPVQEKKTQKKKRS